MIKKAIFRFELSDANVYRSQLVNAQIFERKSLLGRVGFRLMGVCAMWSLCVKFFPQYFIHTWLPSSYTIIAVGSLFIIVAVLGTLFFARCPNCNSLQPGMGRSLFYWKSHAIGFSPFAKRCVQCNYYLSVKELKKDLYIFHTK